MAVDVRVTSTLRNLTGAKSVKADGATVAELLNDLDRRYPGFRAQISGNDGQLHRFVNIYLNDEDIRYLKALDTPLKDGDVVSILPALAGGADESLLYPRLKAGVCPPYSMLQPLGWRAESTIPPPTRGAGTPAVFDAPAFRLG